MKMKETILTIICAGVLLAGSCAKDKPLEELTPLKNDYVLPQGKSPADDRIVELYKKYGSYFLYEFSERDFNWKFFDPRRGNGESENLFSYTPADPKYAGNLLDYLNLAWFRYFPDSLLRKSLPYKVLLVSKLEKVDLNSDTNPDADTDDESGVRSDSEPDPDPEPKVSQPHRLENNQFVFPYCDERITKWTGEEKNKRRRVLQYELISYLVATKVLSIPPRFYKASSYSVKASENPKSINYTRKRGFLFDHVYKEEWSLGITSEDTEYYLEKDLSSYLHWMIVRTDKEWKKDLAYPLVKRKYDMLMKHFKEKLGIDIHKMANEVYE